MRFKDVLKELPPDRVDYELNYISDSNEAFGDLRIISEKYDGIKWFFILTYENYEERRIKDGRD
ncbi:protease, putative [Dictyoglomus thermophilum H-6-12]|uniref:Protease, putative n=2 Tax=Dictyoglomus thermophilum TaxID=14 RepID=B5YEG5_DICT6|nr:protease, putative [Dictyoglomus thermophilum H-6-12]